MGKNNDKYCTKNNSDTLPSSISRLNRYLIQKSKNINDEFMELDDTTEFSKYTYGNNRIVLKMKLSLFQ